MEGRDQRDSVEARPCTAVHSDTYNENPDEGTFNCYLCGIEERYDYKGKCPPFATSIKFIVDSYIMKDPFSPARPFTLHRKHKELNQPFLVLGADCVSCKKSVCGDLECSIFYKHQFCKPCALKVMDIFPPQIQRKLKC